MQNLEKQNATHQIDSHKLFGLGRHCWKRLSSAAAKPQKHGLNHSTYGRVGQGQKRRTAHRQDLVHSCGLEFLCPQPIRRGMINAESLYSMVEMTASVVAKEECLHMSAMETKIFQTDEYGQFISQLSHFFLTDSNHLIILKYCIYE